jgi:hypothetical protein
VSQPDIYYLGRRVLTTAQAAAAKGTDPPKLRAWIARNGIKPAAYVDPRTPVYYPEDLGIEE